MTFRAFFSYARADNQIAGWLHRRLDSYRTPRGLVGQASALGDVPATLHPIYRDRTDLQAGGELSEALKRALEESETLIVLCSPAAAKSEWVNKECETFIQLGRANRIFPVIAEGEPNSSDPALECFPPAIRALGLLAADLREIRDANGRITGDGREGGRLKLIAGLLGVPLDRLVQRERRRQRLINAAFAGAAVAFFAVAVFAVLQSFQARSNLRRFFVERAWTYNEQGDFRLSARYALAGMRLSPQDKDTYAAVLASALDQSRALAPPLVLGQPVNRAVFSPDGERIVTVADAGEIKIWRTSDGALLSTIAGHQRQNVMDAVYAPGGRRLATVGSSVMLWDPRVGAHIHTFSSRHWLDSGGFAAFSPDGFSLMIESGVWRSTDGYRVPGFASNLTQGAFSPDGRTAVSSRYREGMTIWDAVTGRALHAIATAPEETPLAFAYAPDGRSIATVRDRERITIWDVQTGAARLHFETGRYDPNSRSYYRANEARAAYSAEFSPTSDRLLTILGGRVADIWDARDGRLLATLRGHADRLTTAIFSADGARVLTASADGTARVWDAATGQVLFIIRGHAGAVNSAAFSPNGAFIVTAGADGVSRIWDARVTREPTVEVGRTAWIEQEQFSADRRRGVRIGDDPTTLIVVEEGNPRAIATLRGGAQGEMVSASISPNGRRVVSASTDRTLRLWDADTGRTLTSIVIGDVAPDTVRFSPDGERVLAAYEDDRSRIWDVRRFTQEADALAREACTVLLAPNERVFSATEMAADALLQSEWRADRDVCAGVDTSPPPTAPATQQ